MEQVKIENTISRIKQSLKDFEAGDFSSAEEVFGKLRKKTLKATKSSKPLKK